MTDIDIDIERWRKAAEHTEESFYWDDKQEPHHRIVLALIERLKKTEAETKEMVEYTSAALYRQIERADRLAEALREITRGREVDRGDGHHEWSELSSWDAYLIAEDALEIIKENKTNE